jgi:hypothetical protein
MPSYYLSDEAAGKRLAKLAARLIEDLEQAPDGTFTFRQESVFWKLPAGVQLGIMQELHHGRS